MTIHIIIATYNRPVRASKTVQQFLDLEDRFFGQIILVDSSDGLTQSDYQAVPEVVYIRSSHKNQPYQRFLGSRASSADVLLFLDDDMDLIDLSGLLKNLDRFNDSNLVGINFSFRNENAFLASSPKTVSASWNGSFGRFMKTLSGSPKIEDNKFWLCGLRGKRRGNSGIDFVQGGAFAARRDQLFQKMNFQLLDLFEEKMGMGEDMVIGFSLSRKGAIWAAEGETFYHDDQQDSSYAPNQLLFNRKVAFSRLYLSLEYARLTGMHPVLARLHYHWYMLWRSVAMLFSCCMHPNKKRWDGFRGWLAGWSKAVFWKPRSMDEAAHYWQAEAQKDLSDG